VLDVLRVLKSGKSLADSLATIPITFRTSTRTWCARRGLGRAGGDLRAAGRSSSAPRRLAELHHRVDDLSALLALVGLASVLLLLTFVVPRCVHFRRIDHEDPMPTQIMLRRAAS
jgi:general secretion pathway protein F